MTFVSSNTQAAKHVVIVGSGFGGLTAAKILCKAKGVRVTLVDRSNHHLFQPLLYQVATAGLSAPAIAAPIRAILQGSRHLTILMDEVTEVLPQRRAVVLRGRGEISYDYLIVAAGATHSYFGRPEWAKVAPGLKTLDDALGIRSRILRAFERAELETDEAKRREWLNFIVVGGGPTGVEMAGTLAEIARHTLAGEFHHIEPGSARVCLVEGGDRVLQAYDPELSERAREQLTRLGVEVCTGARVTDIQEDGLDTTSASGEPKHFPARTVIWAAGVAASPLGAQLGVNCDRAGRVPVQPDLSLPNHPEVFVIGDLAAAQSKGKPVPGIAPAAKQMGRRAADNVLRSIRGQKTRPFEYRDYGSLATIGRNAAVFQLGSFKMWGWPAWLFWLFVHIFFLIGFRNRFIVFMDWAWSYLTFERGARIIHTSPKTSEDLPT